MHHVCPIVPQWVAAKQNHINPFIEKIIPALWTRGYWAKGSGVRELTFRLKPRSHSCTVKLFFAQAVSQKSPSGAFVPLAGLNTHAAITVMQLSFRGFAASPVLPLWKYSQLALTWALSRLLSKNNPKISKAWAALRA